MQRIIDQTDFTKLYNPELDVFSIGYDTSNYTLLPYHYNNFASEARLTSFLTIAQGDAPYKHWFCLDKTLVQYKGYKGVASWYGTLFEYFMPLIFLPTFKHTLMDETYSFAIRAQKAFSHQVKRGKEELPWGISETAYNELDDAQNYKYHAFGVPYLKFQNTTPDRIVLSPYSSLMTIGIDDKSVYENLQRFKALGMYSQPHRIEGALGSFGLFESYDEEDHVAVQAHYAHHQGMILASLTNYLADHCLQRYFMHEPTMRSMETLLKEKAQVKPYIDLKIKPLCDMLTALCLSFMIGICCIYIKGDSLIVMAIDTTKNAQNLKLILPVKVKSGVHLLSTGNEMANLCQESPITIDEPVSELTVSLPARSVNTYIFMIDKGETAIENVKRIVDDGPKAYYDLCGRRLDKPRGICIEKRADGSSKVVYIRAK